MRASLVMAALWLASSGACSAEDYGLGRAAAPEEIAGWNIDVGPDGAGLPTGTGGVAEGEKIFAEKCAACHGAHGEGKPMDALAGGAGTMATAKPLKTVGSYWPYATTLFDFVRRAMPFDAPQSLTNNEVYAVSAYVLWLNHIVPENIALDAETLPKVVMPNRAAFVSAYSARPTQRP